MKQRTLKIKMQPVTVTVTILVVDPVIAIQRGSTQI